MCCIPAHTGTNDASIGNGNGTKQQHHTCVHTHTFTGPNKVALPFKRTTAIAVAQSRKTAEKREEKTKEHIDRNMLKRMKGGKTFSVDLLCWRRTDDLKHTQNEIKQKNYSY